MAIEDPQAADASPGTDPPRSPSGDAQAPPPVPRALAIGLFLGISVTAFETFAVATALPTIADEFDGDRLYGATFVVYMLANLVALVTAGERADRTGLRRSFAVGATLFVLGLIVAGTASSMLQVLGGRALQGAGTGIFTTLATATVRRAYPEARQRRMYAVLSSAWVLPSLIAPFVAGWITEEIGWRWTFIAIIPLGVAVPLLALPGLAHVDATTVLSPERPASRIPTALTLALGLGLVTAGASSARWYVIAPLAVAGLLVVAPTMRRLMPAGFVVAAPGRPAAIASRMYAMAAFNAADFFIPLAADRVHGATPTVQGATILGAAVTWSAAQWVAAQHGERIGSHRLVPAGFALLALGTLSAISVLFVDVPLWVTFLGWSVGGFGMGLLFNPTSHVAMGAAQADEAGLASTQLAVADVVGFSTMAAFGGAMVSMADQTALELVPALAVVFAAGTLSASVGAVVGRNVREPAPVSAGRQ